MTWTLDPKNEWAKRWELENPEPEIIPAGPSRYGEKIWTDRQVLIRIAWHQKRWEDFQQSDAYKNGTLYV